jgi:hypothetical protein
VEDIMPWGTPDHESDRLHTTSICQARAALMLQVGHSPSRNKRPEPFDPAAQFTGPGVGATLFAKLDRIIELLEE